jgi:hypothetical protein
MTPSYILPPIPLVTKPSKQPSHRPANHSDTHRLKGLGFSHEDVGNPSVLPPSRPPDSGKVSTQNDIRAQTKFSRVWMGISTSVEGVRLAILKRLGMGRMADGWEVLIAACFGGC